MAELTDIPALPKDTATIAPQTRAEKDLQLWHTWKKTQHPEDLRMLLRAYDPVVAKWAGTYIHSGVPHHALIVEAKLNTVKAFKTYDPGRGTQLNTHVTNALQKGQRLVYETRQLTRVPEHRAIRTGSYMSVRDYLRSKLERDPTLDEMFDELSAGHPLGDVKSEKESVTWSKPEIERMERELHKTLLGSEDTLSDIAVQKPSRESELIDYVKYELTPLEQKVYSHLTGRDGAEQLDGIEISKRLGLTPSKVSRIRQKVADIFEKYRNK